MSARESLRVQVRNALLDAGISQAEVARQLGVSTKHLCQMLTGRAALSLDWAEKILALSGQRLEIRVTSLADQVRAERKRGRGGREH